MGDSRLAVEVWPAKVSASFFLTTSDSRSEVLRRLELRNEPYEVQTISPLVGNVENTLIHGRDEKPFAHAPTPVRWVRSR